MIRIDGRTGGGQVLRSSLTLSLITQKPFLITDIRANRSRDGLLRQHLTAAQAAAEVGEAETEGLRQKSRSLFFRPHGIAPGDYAWDIGSAGSTSLVLQTVLPALRFADGRSTVSVTGGTHNPSAPPFEILSECWAPLLGASVELERRGFVPEGGGRVRAHIEPGAIGPISAIERGGIKRIRAKALVCGLPKKIGERELRTLGQELDLRGAEVELHDEPTGNALFVEVECRRARLLFCGFGELRKRAEDVAQELARVVRRTLDADVPVDGHLADQLVLLGAIGEGARFRTLKPTEHLRANIEIIRAFLDVEVEVDRVNDRAWEVRVSPRGGRSATPR